MSSVQNIGRVDFDPIQLVVCWDMNNVLLDEEKRPREMVLRVVDALATFGAVQGVVCADPKQRSLKKFGKDRSAFSFVVEAGSVASSKYDPQGWRLAKARAQEFLREGEYGAGDVLFVGVTGSRAGVQPLLDADMSVVNLAPSHQGPVTLPRNKAERYRAAGDEEDIFAQITGLWDDAMRNRSVMRWHVEKQNKFLLGCCS